MPKKWSDETTCKFVKLYRENECLWNVREIFYRDKNARLKALKQIVSKMGLDDFNIDDAKQKIRSLRATFQQEQCKVEISEKPADAEEIYKPPMKWFEFMQDCMKEKRTRKKKIFGSFENDDIPEGECNEIELDDFQHFMDHQYNTQKQSPECVVPPRNKKRKSNQILSFSSDSQLSNPFSSAMSEDECEIFGKHVAIQLKKLTLEQCILAQEEIQKVLTRGRLNDYRKPSINFMSTVSLSG